MSSTIDTDERPLPYLPASDRAAVEQMYRGVCQEIEGLAEQLKGKQQVKAALKRHLQREREADS